MSEITYARHRNHFPVTTTTTTTTSTSYGPNSGYCNGSNAYNPCQNNGGIQLSSKAQALMTFMGMMGQLIGGPFGEMMSALGVGGLDGQNQGQMHPFSNAHPGFGEPRDRTCRGSQRPNGLADFLHQRSCENMDRGFMPLQRSLARANGLSQARNRARNALQGLTGQKSGGVSGAAGNVANRALEASAPQAPRGKATEMKAGQTMKAPNGSLVSWGKDGQVGIKYKDPNGQMKNIDIKDGMLRLDGGKPVKLENVGQILKLPNGDVIGLGNNPQGPEGKKLCRVVLADNPDQIKTDPASATNVYDIKNMLHTQNAIVPTRYDVNFNSSSYDGQCGHFHSNSFNASVTTGTPIVTSHTVQELHYHGVR